MTKLLAATGYNGDVLTVEVINLDDTNPNLVCENLPSLPYGMFGPVGELFRGTTPIICGGYKKGGEYLNKCNALEKGAWKSIPSMNKPRYWPGKISFSQTSNEKDDILMVVGGNQGAGEALSTVEFYDGKIWNENRFTNYPIPSVGGCMVKINNSMVMSLSGSRQESSNASSGETYFFDVNKNKWASGPKLALPRAYHSCGVMNWKNETTGIFEKILVVAGGNDKQPLKSNSVELLFLNEFEKHNTGWKVGSSLPLKLIAPAMIEFQNGVILVGGSGDGDGRHLFKLLSPFGSWTELKQTLKEPRSYFVSFLVPDELVNCRLAKEVEIPLFYFNSKQS